MATYTVEKEKLRMHQIGHTYHKSWEYNQLLRPSNMRANSLDHRLYFTIYTHRNQSIWLDPCIDRHSNTTRRHRLFMNFFCSFLHRQEIPCQMQLYWLSFQLPTHTIGQPKHHIRNFTHVQYYYIANGQWKYKYRHHHHDPRLILQNL